MNQSIQNMLREKINEEREAVREVEKYVECDVVRAVKQNAAGAIRAYSTAINMIEDTEPEVEQIQFPGNAFKASASIRGMDE